MIGVLALKSVLRIYYKLFSKYLVAEKVIKGSRPKLKMGSRVGTRIKDSSNSFILLSIKKKAHKVPFNRSKKVINI